METLDSKVLFTGKYIVGGKCLVIPDGSVTGFWTLPSIRNMMRARLIGDLLAGLGII